MGPAGVVVVKTIDQTVRSFVYNGLRDGGTQRQQSSCHPFSLSHPRLNSLPISDGSISEPFASMSWKHRRIQRDQRPIISVQEAYSACVFAGVLVEEKLTNLPFHLSTQMAHSLVHHSKTMKRSDSRKYHSWWWDSHITPKNSKWLMDNLEEMDQSVKQMLKMIEEDADSFAKKAEIYYQKRPVLISHVEEFYRLYRSLAERYDCLTGELRKSGSSDLQSQSSGVSDVSEPSSTITSLDHLIGQRRSSNRAAGFDFFLGSGGINSEIYQKEGDASSSLTDSEPESDDSSVKNYATEIANDGDQRLLSRKMIKLEIEHPEAKEKLQMELEENSNGSSEKSEDLFSKILEYEEELRIAREKIRNSAAEITKLKTELQQLKAETASEKKVRSDMDGTFKEVAVKIIKQKLEDSEMEISRLKLEIKENKSSAETQNLQDQFEVARKETGNWKSKLNPDKREVSKLNERISRLKTSLSDRDHEIRNLKTAVSDAEQKIFPEKAQVTAESARLSEEVNNLKEQIRDWECRGRSSEEEIRKAKREKAEDEERLKTNISKLEAELTEKSESMKKLEHSSHELKSEKQRIQMEMNDLRETMEELKRRSKEMEEEVEKQREAINEGAEEKREAIRQLCFSLEHYRKDYHRLRRAFKAHKHGRR